MLRSLAKIDHEPRPKVVLPGKPKEIQAGAGAGAPPLDREAVAVQRSRLDPAKIKTVAGGPNDGVDICLAQIEPGLDGGFIAVLQHRQALFGRIYAGASDV